MRNRSLLVRLIATGVLALAIAVLAPQTLHRRDFDNAIFAYQRNPTAANEQQFKVEQAKHDQVWFVILGIETILLFGALKGFWLLGRRLFSRSGTPSPTS
jgi:hypothetical protein